MNCTKFAVWGKSGSGKSTLSASVALAMASRNQLTGLISCNLQQGDIQAFFGQTIREDKGTFNALEDSTGSVQNYFWKSGVHDNLFLLALPNHYNGLDAVSVSLDKTLTLITGCEIRFNCLVFDVEDNIFNPLACAGLSSADYILSVYRPTVQTCLWQSAKGQFRTLLNLDDRIIPILNADDNTCAGFRENIGLNYTYELPFVPEAGAAENQGKPLYLIENKAAKKYARTVDALLDKLEGRK